MGIVGASCARNPGAPRMTGIQMLLIIVPLSLGALMNANPAIRLVAVLAPAYLWACMSISRQLHGDYIGMLMAEQKVRHVALHCSLTGLPNRAYFNSLLCAALEDGSQHPVCVLFLDLDGFKSVNDTHGHLAGDRLLQQVAERLNRCMSATSLASRLGGDEFAVLTRRLEQQDVQIMAQRLIAEIGRPYRLPDGVATEIGVSIGLATCRGGIDPGKLMKQADTALYAAKRAGKGVCRTYDPGTEAVLDPLPGLV
jgi:diguanylate cyclase (GGDEF)-like protein